MKLPEQIVTPRLALRRRSVEDIDFYFVCGTNPNINRYMSWLAPKDKAEVRELLEFLSRNWESGTSFNYTIFTRSDGQRVGTIEPVAADHKPSVGYVISEENWGKGYATEALSALRDKILEDPTIKRFWTVCDTENPASARVMQKCGMQFEGILRKWRPSPNISPAPRDVFCYSLVR